MKKRNPNLGVSRVALFSYAGVLATGLMLSASALAFQATSTLPDKAGSIQPYASRMDSFSQARSTGEMLVSEDVGKLPLAPGFLVSINVLDEPDVNGTFRLDQEGNVQVPVLGSVHVGGLTPPEASRMLRQKLLDDEILKDPQVTVSVLEYTAGQVTILGEVGSPGKYPLLLPHSLVDVLALAGSLTPTAGHEVEITHAGSASAAPTVVQYSRDSAANSVADVIIHPGDTVRVRRAGIVYVLGAVIRPGGYVMQEEGTLNIVEAISMASGTSPAADTRTIHILRPNDDGSIVDIPLSYKRLTHGKTAPIALQAKDIVYVPTSRVKAVFAGSAGVLNSAATAAIYSVH